MRNRLKARFLAPRDREAVLAFLSKDPRANLQLLELASRLGNPASQSEVAPQLVGAWRGAELTGVVSLRPSVVLDSGIDAEMVDVMMPFIESIPSGLMKSGWDGVTKVWHRLASGGRGSLVDREETAYAVRPEQAVQDVERVPGVYVRGGEDRDLDALVDAARASLREEGRPDPFHGDPPGFCRWVRGRLPRARVVVESGGVEGRVREKVLFVGYADVRRPEGWLVQGVYTFPEARQRGLATLGMAALVREAFAAGADHVQLAVVSGNVAAIRLYERLGFEPFANLRTVLFV